MQKPKLLQRARPLIGTLVEIAIGEVGEDFAEKLFATAFAEVSRLEKILSHHVPQSDVSKINSLPAHLKLKLNPEAGEVLQLAIKLFEESKGLFDVVVPQSRDRVCSSDISFDCDTISLSKPLIINLGGIAKGYIVDKVFALLETYQLDFLRVSAGGDLRVSAKESTDLYIRDPNSPSQHLKIGEGRDFACATSSDYFRKANLRDVGLYHPLIGPTSFQDKSISVISDSCAISDALTKVVMLSEICPEELLSKFKAQAFIYDKLPSSQSLTLQ